MEEDDGHGYLISSLLIQDLEAGRFSLLRFYERRARRILPALFVVLAACVPCGLLWLYPTDFRQFSESMSSVAWFGSNFYFWRASSYFDTASELKPLLHTWSLAVEEQYYLLFPLVLAAAWRLGRRRLVLTFSVLAGASLAASIWAASNTPTLNFYMLPTRFWELLLGVLAALCWPRFGPLRASSRASEVGAALGIALILVSIFLFDKDTPFPSAYTLAPTLGAVLIICCATPSTWSGRLLGSKWAVGIGLVSYSLYLWHQPMLAFARNRELEEPGPALMAALCVGALALAYLSWRFVETPVRKMRRSAAVLPLSAVGLVAFAVGGRAMASWKESGALSPDQAEIYSFTNEDFGRAVRADVCFLDPDKESSRGFGSECAPAPGPGSVLVWGDSHAAALSVGVRALGSNVAQYTAARCPPLVGRSFVTAKSCDDLNGFILGEVARTQPGAIVLHAYWYAYGSRAGELEHTIEEVRRLAPRTRIVVVGTVPLWPSPLPLLMLKHNLPLSEGVRMRLPLIHDLRALDQRLRSLSDRRGAVFVSALDSFCAGDSCQITAALDGLPSPVSFDYAHLTGAGALQLARPVLEIAASSTRERPVR